MNATILGLIVVPVSIFLLGATVAAIKGAIRFAQYLVRSEEAQDKTATSAQAIAERLDEYMKKTDDELRDHAQRLAVLEFARDVHARKSEGHGR